MTGRCSLFGRHYVHTFDGVLYEFPGDCSYLLAGDCNHRTFTLLGESDYSMEKQNCYGICCSVWSVLPLELILTGICVVYVLCYKTVVCASSFFHPSEYSRSSSKKINVKFDEKIYVFSIHRWFCWWQKNWSHSVSGRCLWTPPVCRRMALTRRK